jgi:hypothetical protein
MNLSLDPTQVELLRQVLDSTYRDLKYETANTDNSSFKMELRDRGQRLRTILDLVGGPLPDAS